MSEAGKYYADRLLLFENDVDLEARRLYLTSDVAPESVRHIIKGIHYFNEDETRHDEPIEIYICTPGGDMDLMFAIYDAIQQSKSPVHTIGTGSVCSAGVLILAGGHHRFATENCWLMHHLAWGDSMGDEREIVAKAAASKRMNAMRYELLAKHTKKSKALWEKKATAEGEVWLNAQEMLAWGIIDEIITFEPKKRKRNENRVKKSEGPKFTKARMRAPEVGV